MQDIDIALYTLGFAIFIFVLIASWRYSETKKKKKRHPLIYLGIFLIGFAAYVIPIGVMEVYEITANYLHLSFLENYALWIAISVVCFIIGIMLVWKYKRGEK